MRMRVEVSGARRARLRRAARSALERAARGLMLDRQARFWMRELGLWGPGALWGRVASILQEGPETKTFTLEPSAGWMGHEPGQFTQVGVEIDGVWRRRCYSISSAPSARHVTLSVRRIPGGRVSTYLHDRVRVGDLLRLEQAAGAFTLPSPVPSRLLFIAGGTGITPMLSMLRALADRESGADVTLLYYARAREHAVGLDALLALKARLPRLQLIPRFDDDEGRGVGYIEAELRALVPDFRERRALLCGPEGLMRAVRETWAREGIEARLREEAFTAAPRPTRHEGEAVEVTLARSGRTVKVPAGASLLEGLEAAGEHPAYGCRMGICRSCRCAKISGVVEDLLSGARSSEPEADLALCVSTPRSDVELDL